MASRQNVAERFPLVGIDKELEASLGTHSDEVIDMPRSEVVTRLRIGGNGELIRTWSPEIVRRFPLDYVQASIRTAIVDASIPFCVFAVASLTIFILASVLVRSPHVAGEIEVLSYTLRPQLQEWQQDFLGVWQHWDGLWYLKIATQGYDDWDFSTAFFPFYPLLIRAIGSIINADLLSTGVAVSAVFYLVALVYTYKLARRELNDEGVARRSIIYLAIFPTSFFFIAVYTESMYLALSVATFYYARQGRWKAVGALGVAASLTRSTGLLLLLPLLMEYLQQRDFRLSAVRADIGYLMLVPLGTGFYAAYNFFTFGDPLAFVKAQVHWERSFTWPWDTLSMAWDLAINDANIPLVTESDGSLIYQALEASNLISGHAYNLVFFVLALALTLVAFKTLRPAYALYALLVIAVPIFNPSGTMPLLSMPRFVVVLFPLFFVLALMGKNRLAHWTISAAFVVGLFFFLLRFASWYWVA